jgi:hypothetical protein
MFLEFFGKLSSPIWRYLAIYIKEEKTNWGAKVVPKKRKL